MAADVDLNDVDEVRRRVVDPVLTTMLRPGERVSADLVVGEDWPDTDEADWAWKRWPNNSHAPRPGDEPNSLYLVVRAGEDEQHTTWLGTLDLSRHDAADVAERLASGLHDWVAESSFGWGEARSAEDVVVLPRRPDGSGRAVVGLWVGGVGPEVTVDGAPVHPATLGLSVDLVDDVQAWYARYAAWAAGADAAERRRSEVLAAKPSGLQITYVDAARTVQEIAAVRAAREQAHLGSWRRLVAELEPARDALLARLQAELGPGHVAPPPARVR